MILTIVAGCLSVTPLAAYALFLNRPVTKRDLRIQKFLITIQIISFTTYIILSIQQL